jgi:hypothetical protein
VENVRVVGARLEVPTGTKVVRRRAGGDAIELHESGFAIACDEQVVVKLTSPESGAPLILELSRQSAPKATPRGALFQRRLLGIGLASLMLHAGLTTALSLMPGATLDDSDEALDRSTIATLRTITANAADRERVQEESKEAASESEAGGQTGGAHKGPSGDMGSLGAPAVSRAYSIKGPAESTEAHLQNIRTTIDNQTYGALGALSAALASTNTPVDADSAFATAIGHDAVDANGNLMGDLPGDAYGHGGLGLVGSEPGGGGLWDGLGVGTVNVLGHGPGEGGYSVGGCVGGVCGHGGPKRPTHGVKILETGSDITGGLPREVVQRIIRANFPRLRACYDVGLKRDPSMHGTVRTRFIIDTTGAVESASLASSTIGDAGVSSCVVGVFSSMSFPEPTNGKALVSYPVDLETDQ